MSAPLSDEYPEDGAAVTAGRGVDSPPPLLAYFASGAPDGRPARAVTLWSLVLLLGWAPYVCGVVNTMAIARSYSPTVIASHQSGAVLFMGMGILASVACLARFVRMRHLTGACASATVLLLQLSVAACIGLGR